MSVAISGATEQSYLLTSADIGRSVRVQAIYTDDSGNKETVVSPAPVTAVAAVDTGPNRERERDGACGRNADRQPVRGP